MAIFPGSAIPSAVSDYEIENSLRSPYSASSKLTRTPTVAGNRRTFTVSMWFKGDLTQSEGNIIRTKVDSSNYFIVGFSTTDGDLWVGTNFGETKSITLSRLLRDPSAWYHLVVAIDTTLGTEADRTKIYLNGTRQTEFSSASYPTENNEGPWNNTVEQHVVSGGGDSYALGGYVAEFYNIDGTALTADSFGELDSATNQWIPLDSNDVKDAVTFGTNGFYQKYNSTELATSFTDNSIGGFTPTEDLTIDYLVIAGGGGGGIGHSSPGRGGGGGAGGYRASFNSEASGGGGSSETAISVSADISYVVTVGDGGAGSTSSSADGSNGGDSSIAGSDITTITSVGGGGAGSGISGTGATGGSGGGTGINGSGGAGTSNQGYAGGYRTGGYAGGGGGGAGSVGSNGSSNDGGDGGAGVASTITGASVTRAGGGGASADDTPGSGGSGGGGAGCNTHGCTGTAGTVNTGSGGGGGAFAGGAGGAGGSGVVIISYISTTVKAIGGTITSYADGGDTYQVHTFNSSSQPTPRHTITANGDATNQRPQSHTITANSNAYMIGPKVGTSVAEFQGTTSDRLSVAASSDFNFGTGDWTVEVFVNKDQDLDASIYRFGDGSPVIELIIDENDKPKWYVENTSGTGYSANGADGDTELNRWYHLAAVKSGTTLTFYLNGVSKATATGLSGDFGNATDTTDVGSRGSAEKAFGGYMDSLRVSNSARYTENFTPPTTSFTNDSNTKLLIQNGTDGSQTFTDGSSSSHTITVNGDVRWVAPKIGAGAMAFDGSAAYSIADSPGYDFDDGPFTIETWLKFNTVEQVDILIKYDDHGSVNQRSWGLKYPGTGSLEFLYSTDGSSWETELTFSWTPSAHTWYHVALTRDSSSDIRAFIDGSQIGVTTNVTDDFYSSTSLLVLGADMSNGSISTSHALDGFMGPTRISKGVARYTANFTAPTTLFTDAINDTLIANADVNYGTWNPDSSTGLAISTDSRMKFDGSGDYLSTAASSDWNFGTDGFTVEFWANGDSNTTRRESFTLGAGSNNINFDFNESSSPIWVYWGSDGSADASRRITPSGSAGDYTDGKWRHLALVRNGTTVTFYVDGASVGSQTGYSAALDCSASGVQVGRMTSSGVADWLGYMDEIRISNTARYTSAFTPQTRGNPFTEDSYTKLLIHSDYTGGLGADSSGNYNNFTATNLVATDQMVDTPTNNFCTLSPVDLSWSAGSTIGPPTLTEGNLKSTKTSGSNGYEQGRGTIAVSSGKWYYEMRLDVAGTGAFQSFGIATTSTDSLIYWAGNKDTQWAYQNEGNTYNNDSATGTDVDTYTTGDIVSVAFDCDAGKVWFAKNNTWQGAGSPNPATGTDANYTNLATVIASDGNPVAPISLLYSSSASESFNFGSDSSFAGTETAQGNQDGNEKGDFYYEPPSGFLALCADNLSTPEVKLPGDNFNIVEWTGDDANPSPTRVLGFQPDLVWITNTSSSLYAWNVYDVLRGVEKKLNLSYPSVEATDANGLKSFEATGFTTGAAGITNDNPWGYRAWGWLAGGSGVANDEGSISSTVSANTTAGLSIVKWVGDDTAGATIGHGLSQAPDLVILKSLDITGNSQASSGWPIYARPMGNTKYMYIDAEDAQTTDSGRWNDTTPSASVFTVGDDGIVNTSGKNYIAWCFHTVEGYSHISTYTGNGDDDGPFAYCPFTPKFFLLKNMDSSDNWILMTNPPNDLNPAQTKQTTSSNIADGTDSDNDMDFVSNGVKFRSDYATINEDDDEFLFIAFAESPFKYSNGR